MEKSFEEKFGVSFEESQEEELEGQTTIYDWDGGKIDEFTTKRDN